MSLDEMLDLAPKQKKKRVSLTVDPLLYEEAQKIAARNNIPMSRLVEGLLKVWVDSKKSLIKE